MNGKLLGGGLMGIALVAGAAMYYLQVYHFYTPVAAETVEIELTLLDGTPEPIRAEAIQAIDANSSPIRFRACFATPEGMGSLTETYVVYQDPAPNVAPGWFDCFDAAALGEALEEGAAIAFLGVENVVYGIDRVVAIDFEGRGWAWHQINPCGRAAFDGDPVPQGCPLPPE